VTRDLNSLQLGHYAESSLQEPSKLPAKLKLVKPAPATELQRVGRKSDKSYGRDGHKYLTPEQVEALVKAAKDATGAGLARRRRRKLGAAAGQ
jgi:hypothetical protein